MNQNLAQKQHQGTDLLKLYRPNRIIRIFPVATLRLLRSLVSLSTVFLILFLQNMDINASPSESSKVTQSSNYFLGLPENDEPVEVGVGFRLHDIDKIDDEAETFQFTGVLTLTWKDKRQAFDPKKEGVAEKIFQGNFQFNRISPAWFPQVVLLNESGMYQNHGVLLRVKPDGSSKLLTTVSAIVKDKFDMWRYPFDVQRLDAVFGILGFDRNEVLFKTLPESNEVSSHKVRLSQWELSKVHHSTGEEDSSSTFIVTMEVRRKSFFILRLVVIPLALIVVLSWSVFWMDRSSMSDRISISFVGILTAVAYQIVVGGILPHISYITLMNGFVNLSLFTMSATVIINLVVGACAIKGKLLLGDRIDLYCRWIFPLVYFGTMTLFMLITFIYA